MKKKLIVFIPIIVAIATIVYLAKSKPEPKKIEKVDEKIVKIQELKATDTNILIKSFGNVQSKEEINFISAVSGDIVYKDEKLIEGNFIKKGVLLLKIDDKEYKLNIKNLQAQISGVVASKKELEVELLSTKSLLEIEEQRLALDKKELEKYKRLKTHVSDSTLSQYKNQVLARQNSVQNLLGKLETLPLKIKASQANIKALETQKEIAQISLDDCNIYMPFDGIVYDIDVQNKEFINKNQKLFQAYDSSKMQIELEISVSELSKFKDINDLEDIKAQLYSSSLDKNFKSSFVNISKNINEKTRTLSLLFKIEEPIYKGVFLDAEVVAKQYKDVISIPKNIYKNEKVAIVLDGRLHFKDVKIIDENIDSYIVEGLQEGDNLIISNLPDAIEGMKLKVVK